MKWCKTCRKFAHAYLDDLVVFSDSWTKHLGHLETILEKLQEFGLTAKMAECQLSMAECTYLGHVVGGGYVKPEINKLEAMERELFSAKKQKRRSIHSLDSQVTTGTSLKSMLS